MVRSVLRLEGRDLGFDRTSVLTLKIDPPWTRFARVEQTAPFYKRALDEILTLPGVTAAATNDALPLTDAKAEEGQAEMGVTVEGQSAEDAEANPYVAAQIVSHGYLATLRIPLLQGRGFEDADRIGTTPVALVSERTAERLWPGGDALGRRLRLGRRNANYRPAAGSPAEEPWLTVVGVVGAVRRDATGPAAFDVYMSDQQLFAPETYLLVRGHGEPAAPAAAVREAIMRVDREQTVFDARTLSQRLADRIWQYRLSGRALVALALLALVLAAVGLYALVARDVAGRRREIAIRASLGARPGDVLRLVVGDVLPLLAAGSLGGLVAAAVLQQVIRGLVHAPVPADWLVLPGVAMGLSIVGLVAAALPARRAARTDPALALRSE
jgi:putative ABC transport system permease protein